MKRKSNMAPLMTAWVGLGLGMVGCGQAKVGTSDTARREKLITTAPVATSLSIRTTGFCISVGGNPGVDGAPVVQQPCDNSALQTWKLTPNDQGQYTVVNSQTGKCLDVPGGGTANGLLLIQWNCWGGPNQAWNLKDLGNGFSSLQSGDTGKCVDLPGGTAAYGAQMQQWDCVGNWNQSLALNAGAPGGGGGIPSDPNGAQAAHSQDVIDRFGVNMHIGTINDGYDDAVYNNVTTPAVFDSIVNDLKYINVKNIRDWAYAKNGQGITYWPKIWQASGAQYLGVVPGNTSESEAYTNLQNYRNYAAANPGMFMGYDGMNEADIEGNTLYNSQDLQRGYNSPNGVGVFAAAHADGLKAFCFSTGKLGQLADQTAYCDYGNAHTYFDTGHGPEQAPDQDGYGPGILSWAVASAKVTAPGVPTAVTEWGYQYTLVAGQDQAVQAAYILDFIMSGFMQGLPYYFYYGLYDDGSGNWGLFNSDYSARPASDSLHTLFALLGDTGSNATSFGTGKLDYSLGGDWSSLTVKDFPNMGGKQLLLQKSDGSFWLMLNNEQNNAYAPSANVTLNLATFATSISVYDPMNASYRTAEGANPVQTATNSNSITLQLPAHPILVKIVRP